MALTNWYKKATSYPQELNNMSGFAGHKSSCCPVATVFARLVLSMDQLIMLCTCVSYELIIHVMTSPLWSFGYTLLLVDAGVGNKLSYKPVVATASFPGSTL